MAALITPTAAHAAMTVADFVKAIDPSLTPDSAALVGVLGETKDRLAGPNAVLSSPDCKTRHHNHKFGHIDRLGYVRLIAGKKRSFAVFGARKRR